MTCQVTLRTAAASDEGFLAGLQADAHPELLAAGLPPAALEQLLDLQRQAQRSEYLARYPDALDQLILADGRPAGRCWTAAGPDEHRLLDLAVHSSFRRQGIAAAVVGGLCQQALAAGLPLRLTVWQANLAASELYRGLGFRLIGADATASEGYQAMEWSPRVATGTATR